MAKKSFTAPKWPHHMDQIMAKKPFTAPKYSVILDQIMAKRLFTDRSAVCRLLGEIKNLRY